MRKFILTVRPEPDGALDVAALARRNVPALSAPLMAPSYLARKFRHQTNSAG